MTVYNLSPPHLSLRFIARTWRFDAPTITIWGIYKLSLDLLWLFFLNYYPEKEDVLRNQMKKESLKYDETVMKLRSGLIETGGISE